MGRQQGRVGQGPQQRDVAEAVMDSTITAHEAGSVKTQANGKALQADFLERLVEGPLEERGIHREEGAESGFGEARHHVHGVGFTNAHIPCPVWIFLENASDAGAVRHRRGARHHSVVLGHR